MADPMRPLRGPRDWIVSSSQLTCRVSVDANGVVTGGGLVIQKFVGRPVSTLCEWLQSHRGGYRCVPLATAEEWRALNASNEGKNP